MTTQPLSAEREAAIRARVAELERAPTDPGDTAMPDPAAPELTATLIIGGTSSRCGLCGEKASMDATHHTDVPGYPGSRQPGGGCGARFVALDTDYAGVTAERLRELRPDLPVVGVAAALRKAADSHAPAPDAPADRLRARTAPTVYVVQFGDTPRAAAGTLATAQTHAMHRETRHPSGDEYRWDEHHPGVWRLMSRREGRRWSWTLYAVHAIRRLADGEVS